MVAFIKSTSTIGQTKLCFAFSGLFFLIAFGKWLTCLLVTLAIDFGDDSLIFVISRCTMKLRLKKYFEVAINKYIRTLKHYRLDHLLDVMHCVINFTLMEWNIIVGIRHSILLQFGQFTWNILKRGDGDDDGAQDNHRVERTTWNL